MQDLFRSSVSNLEFQRWLAYGNAPLTISRNGADPTLLIKVQKTPAIDYLYRTAITTDTGISWDNPLLFSGVYDLRNLSLYLTKDFQHYVMPGMAPSEEQDVPSMLKEISGRIRQRVEDIIANDRSVLPAAASQELREYQCHGAKEESLQLLLDSREPNELPEAAFLAYIQDPETFIQTEAEQYVKTHQEALLLQHMNSSPSRQEAPEAEPIMTMGDL